MWVKMREKTGGNSTLFGHNGDFTGFMFYHVPENSSRLRLVYGTGDKWKVNVCDHKMKRGTWHHLVAVLDRRLSRFSVVIDGSVAHGEQIENMAWLDDLHLRISAADEHSFHGEIDEVLVFDRGLSLPEIQQLYRHSQDGNRLVD